MQQVQIFNFLGSTFLGEHYIYFIIIVAISLLGFLLGSFGTVIVLRKEALIADGISHAALPGIVLSFMLFGKRSIPILMLGAVVSSGIMMLFFRLIKRYTNVKKDALLAVLLSGFFGFGQVLMSILNKTPQSGKSGIDKFMFGQLATVQPENIYTVIITSVIIFTVLILFWKEIKLSTFDPGFYSSLGYSNKLIDLLLTFLIVISVVIGIEMVGVILISAILIIPTVVARWSSDRFSLNFIISGLTGVLSGILGTIFTKFVNIPPGPSVVVFLSFFAIMAIIFAPKKGYLIKLIKRKRQEKLLKRYHYIVHLANGGNPYELENNEKEILIEKGYIIKNAENGLCVLTEKGKELANDIFNGVRLWQKN